MEQIDIALPLSPPARRRI